MFLLALTAGLAAAQQQHQYTWCFPVAHWHRENVKLARSPTADTIICAGAEVCGTRPNLPRDGSTPDDDTTCETQCHEALGECGIGVALSSEGFFDCVFTKLADECTPFCSSSNGTTVDCGYVFFSPVPAAASPDEYTTNEAIPTDAEESAQSELVGTDSPLSTVLKSVALSCAAGSLFGVTAYAAASKLGLLRPPPAVTEAHIAEHVMAGGAASTAAADGLLPFANGQGPLVTAAGSTGAGIVSGSVGTAVVAASIATRCLRRSESTDADHEGFLETASPAEADCTTVLCEEESSNGSQYMEEELPLSPLAEGNDDSRMTASAESSCGVPAASPGVAPSVILIANDDAARSADRRKRLTTSGKVLPKKGMDFVLCLPDVN